MIKHGRTLRVGATLAHLGGRFSAEDGGFLFHIFPASKINFGPFGQIEISKRNCYFTNRFIVGIEDVCI